VSPIAVSPRKRVLPCCRSSSIRGSPAAFFGPVYAEDEESAVATAIKEYDVRPAEQKRLFAGRLVARIMKTRMIP
jgi:hypothetical protein